ncbi:uncharacterized protein LOC121718854 isoform X2 [Alosa sapidissima]|uniref:uncharacterized protein LOC121718854 isoform X2 n=1 Tax=Alosa sapidissima TaxID=34773 RepID=UPI001C080E6A|nr:uncharacterized protein LOC121718854 isoform X2 [Alosa sapidissima]
MDLGLPFSSGCNVTEMQQVDLLSMMVKQEDIKEEEYCHIPAFQHDEEKPFVGLHCETDIEIDVAESSGTETQQTTAVTLKKEEDEKEFDYRDPVSLAQMKRVSVVLVDCCRTQGQQRKKDMQTNREAHQPETTSSLQQGTAKRLVTKKTAAVSKVLLCDDKGWMANMESRLAARTADLTSERARVAQLLAENASLKADLSASRAEADHLRREIQGLREASQRGLLVEEMRAGIGELHSVLRMVNSTPARSIPRRASTPAPEVDSSDCQMSPSALSSSLTNSIQMTGQWADVSLRDFGPEDHVRLLQMSFGQVGRYGCLLFRHIISEENYQAWSKTTNWDGSRGKRSLPQNVKSFVVSTLRRHFPDMDRGELKECVDKINEFLRTTRKNSQGLTLL